MPTGSTGRRTVVTKKPKPVSPKSMRQDPSPDTPSPRTWRRRLFKAALIFGFIILVLAGLALLLVDPVIKAMAEKRLTRSFGMKVTIDDLDVGIFRSDITISGLKIFHRQEFGGQPLLEMPELYVDYNWKALRQRKVLHFERVRLHLQRVNLVADTTGKTFFNQYKQSISQSRRPVSTSKTQPTSGEKQKQARGFSGIDELKLTLGKLRVTDMRRPGWSREYGVNIPNAVFRDLRTRDDFETMFLQLIAVMGLYTGFERALERWDEMERQTPAKSSP